MQSIQIHATKDEAETINTFFYRRPNIHCERISMPDDSTVFVAVNPDKYTRHELDLLRVGAILLHPHSPGVIGGDHAKRFPHVKAHEKMTPYELRQALYNHPAHPHPMLHPEW